MDNYREIKVNTEKLDAVKSMNSPTSHMHVKIFNGRLLGLSRFLTNYGKKSFPFLQVLRANNKFEWTL